MTAETDLLPFTEYLRNLPAHCRGRIDAYARACVSSATEALRAEVGRLQEEIDNRWAMGVHTCHVNCQRHSCVQFRRAERLAEELRIAMQALIPLHNAHMPDERAGLTDEDVAAAEAAFEQARAALEQETTND